MNGKERLYRSREKKVIGGVAGGLGEYLNIDPVILRVLFVIFAIINGLGILLYILLWIVVPEEPYGESFTVETENSSYKPDEEKSENPLAQGSPSVQKKENRGRIIAGVILIGLGLIFLAENWFPYFDFEDLFPAILIIGGGLLVYHSIKKDREKK